MSFMDINANLSLENATIINNLYGESWITVSLLGVEKKDREELQKQNIEFFLSVPISLIINRKQDETIHLNFQKKNFKLDVICTSMYSEKFEAQLQKILFKAFGKQMLSSLKKSREISEKLGKEIDVNMNTMLNNSVDYLEYAPKTQKESFYSNKSKTSSFLNFLKKKS